MAMCHYCAQTKQLADSLVKNTSCTSYEAPVITYEGNTKPLFRPAAATARLHRRPLLARSAGGSPSTPRLPAAAARRRSAA